MKYKRTNFLFFIIIYFNIFIRCAVCSYISGFCLFVFYLSAYWNASFFSLNRKLFAQHFTWDSNTKSCSSFYSLYLPKRSFIFKKKCDLLSKWCKRLYFGNIWGEPLCFNTDSPHPSKIQRTVSDVSVYFLCDSVYTLFRFYTKSIKIILPKD